VKGLVKKQNKRNGLIFTGNKSRAQKVYQVLKDDQHKKLFLIHKDLEIKERKKMLDDFKKSGGVIIATDIMARGVDISHLQWVLNFDIPSAPDYYLHRCGRVGRAGRAGDVFNFVTSKDALRQKNINIALMQQGRTDLKIPSTVIKKKKKAPIKKKTEKKRRVKQTKRTLKYGR
jgi:ATP-dependent RNA helicase DeaD